MSVITRLFRQATQPPETIEPQPIDAATLAPAELLVTALGNGAAAGELQRAARQRLAELLDSAAVTPQSLNISGDARALLSIVGICRNESVVAAALVDISDEEQLGELALHGTGPVIRRLAAERVRTPALLGRLLKDAQGKDKHVYRILKTKRDALHAADRAAAEALAMLHTLCGTIERHSHQPFGDTYASTVEFLGSQWQAVAENAPEELRAQAGAALARCRDVIAIREQQQTEAAARAATLAAAAATRRSLLEDVAQLLATAYAANTPEAADTLAVYQSRWREAAATLPPAKSEQADFDSYCHAIGSVLECNARHGSVTALSDELTEVRAALLAQALRHLPLLGDTVPEAAQTAAATLQAWHAARTAEHEAAANAQRQAASLLRKAQAALSGGNSRQAAGIRRSLDDKLQAMPDMPAPFTAQLQSFDEKLALLQDWRSYAVAPKRTELIEQMEALIGSSESPQQLAETIHKLQAEWKLISKGNTEDTSAEWERFHAAAQQAYEPCKSHFAAQAELRADNLAKRSALLERLQSFIDAQTWEQTDWREVARALRESRLQWRSHQPVERAANKPLQQRFDALTADLQTRIDAEYARNTEAKRQLIARAERLAVSADPRQAAEDVKRLQLDWKDIGLVPQEVSQKLWDEFRKHCDAVFERRQQRVTEQSALQSANLAQATALCAEVEGLTSLAGAELTEAVTKRLPALREAFNAVGDLPRDAARGLWTRLERAADNCERQLARQRSDAQLAAWDRVIEAGDAIRRLQLARANDQSPELCAELRQATEGLLASDTPWPKGALAVLKAALAADGAVDVSANETALRTLCVRAELLTGTPTPDTEQAFRRNYQLQELAKGFGQARETGRDAQQALLLEWVGIGATRDAIYAACFERLTRCRQQGAAR